MVDFESLRDQQTYLDVLIGSLKSAVVVVSEEGKILFWSQSAQGIFGYQPGEVNETLIQDSLLKNTAEIDKNINSNA